MRVIVHINIASDKETILEGEAAIFGKHDYRQGVDRQLRDLGFWLEDWCYLQSATKGAPHKGKVFIPWGSALYIQEVP